MLSDISTPLTGSCLCGAISVALKDPAPAMEAGLHVCHCRDCRRNTGSVAAHFLMPATTNLVVTGQPAEFVHEGTGSTVKRFFCPTCGSRPLFGIVGRFPDIRFVHSGIFPPGTLPAPSSEIWRVNAEQWEPVYASVKKAKVLETQPPQSVDA